MSDVAELETRINAALERIGAGLEGLGAAARSGGSGEDLAALQDELQAEKTANSQLEERVIAIKDKQEKLVAGLEAEVGRLRDESEKKSQDAQAMKKTNRRLRENNQALRDANLEGVGEPDLINAGMFAELDSLRKSREADRAELDAILTELQPIVEGAANA